MTQSTESRIEHLPAQSRFALYRGDTLAAYADYSQRGDLRDFDHTVTDPQFRGHGLAGQIVRYALDATREEGLKIGTSCSYVEKFVAEHPEYRN
ncbi:GNAT family N-acetyltransferase [Rhodococcus chondri]|uniref:GNAT family N-acetyltransferase n=1 Tax=Rhodococcus chondri TaxID=3065941 RepID=A0ABU7JX59_9NOCA|nr:GNAT family N-acetyltransferase [Rhodococcus sp. CC-R104]MEE2033852.1 GNAT family N-acetyltransferase [Rhodococcus sp. CC-R104]